ncbi:hypothetical protein FQZ97_1048340 [compost metagenome]
MAHHPPGWQAGCATAQSLSPTGQLGLYGKPCCHATRIVPYPSPPRCASAGRRSSRVHRAQCAHLPPGCVEAPPVTSRKGLPACRPGSCPPTGIGARQPQAHPAHPRQGWRQLVHFLHWLAWAAGWRGQRADSALRTEAGSSRPPSREPARSSRPTQHEAWRSPAPPSRDPLPGQPTCVAGAEGSPP